MSACWTFHFNSVTRIESSAHFCVMSQSTHSSRNVHMNVSIENKYFFTFTPSGTFLALLLFFFFAFPPNFARRRQQCCRKGWLSWRRHSQYTRAAKRLHHAFFFLFVFKGDHACPSQYTLSRPVARVPIPLRFFLFRFKVSVVFLVPLVLRNDRKPGPRKVGNISPCHSWEVARRNGKQKGSKSIEKGERRSSRTRTKQEKVNQAEKRSCLWGWNGSLFLDENGLDGASDAWPNEK